MLVWESNDGHTRGAQPRHRYTLQNVVPKTGAVAPKTGAVAPSTGAVAPKTGAVAPSTGAVAPTVEREALGGRARGRARRKTEEGGEEEDVLESFFYHVYSTPVTLVIRILSVTSPLLFSSQFHRYLKLHPMA